MSSPGYTLQQWWSIASGYNSLFIMLLLFRVSNAILCRTLFVPDEQWQCLEIAYRMVFDRGYLSWEWQKGIRGYTHPLVFAALYKTLAVLKLDTPTIMALSPRILQSILAAISDLYVYRVTRTIFSSTTAKYAVSFILQLIMLLSYILSWFTFYTCTRTLSNTIETSLTPLILYYWLMATKGNKVTRNTFLYLSLSAISVTIRPTGAIMWTPLLLYHLLLTQTVRIKLMSIACIVGLFTILWSLLIDRYFYGQWVITPLNFLKFNVIEGSSALFGVHPWHWYLSQGLPTLLFTSIPFFLHGVWEVTTHQYGRHSMVPLCLGVWLVVAHSFLKHKEFRFVQPFLPLTSVYIGVSLNKINRSLSSHHQWPLLKVFVVGLLLVNIPMSAYFCLVHQRGGYAVMDQLRYEHLQNMSDDSTILFLMPCHSTPQYSLLHTNATLSFLHCQYEWNANDIPFIDEYFYQDPILWVRDNLINNHTPPNYIILYDVLYEEIKIVLEKYYQMTNSIFHTHFKDNDRIGDNIIILKKRVIL